MLFVKTQAGQEALKERHGGLTPRQRSAFILFDGKRTLAQVLAATAPMGITEADVQTMLDQGLLSLAAEGGSGVRAASAALPKAMDSGRSDQQRYQDAYPLATEVTASLGLRGFRLNLAVEGASGFSALAALAPKIHQAVGDAKYRPLEQALFA